MKFNVLAHLATLEISTKKTFVYIVPNKRFTISKWFAMIYVIFSLGTLARLSQSNTSNSFYIDFNIHN